MSRTYQERADNNKRLRNFVIEANHLIQDDCSGGFRACGELLESICRDGVFTELINYELDCLLHDSNYSLEASTDIDMLVWKSPYFTLLLKLLIEPQRQDRLFGMPFDHILAPVSARGVTFDRYHQPRPLPNDVFDRTRRIVFAGEETLIPGQSRYFRAGQDIFLIRNDVSEKEPPLLAVFASPDKLSLRWEYDRTTLAPVRAAASDTSASRLEFVAWMMSAMNNHSSLPALEGLLAHPAHFVRWAALKAIYRLDSEKGRELLFAALEDSHEHVRNAARRSLGKLYRGASAIDAGQVADKQSFIGLN